jgi:hypothetical protein
MGVSPLIWRKKLMDSISGNLGYLPKFSLELASGALGRQPAMGQDKKRLDTGWDPLYRAIYLRSSAREKVEHDTGLTLMRQIFKLQVEGVSG